MSRSMCPYLFQSLMISPYSEVRPCCRFDPTVYDENFIWSGETSLKEFYTSEPYRSLRELALRDEPIKGCHRCYHEESLGIQSMRQKPFPVEDVRPSSADQVELITMELGVGRLCNLKCRSCDSFYSTKWEGDSEILGRPKPPGQGSVDLSKIDDGLLPELRSLKITGGEPLLSQQFVDFLKRLNDQKLAGQVEIEMFSNATLKPSPQLLQLLDGFAKVQITLSVDAIGPKNTFLRFPSKWSAVQTVVETWLQEEKARPNLAVGFGVTVSIYNVLYVFELLDWLRALSPERRLPVVFQIVHDPQFMSVALFPEDIRNRLHERFAQDWEGFKAKHGESTYKKQIEKLARVFSGQDHSLVGPDDFYRENGSLDRLRGESFAQVFPELHSILTSGARIQAPVNPSSIS